MQARPHAAALEGAWNATVTVNKVEVPFRFEIEERDGALVGSFFDGNRRLPSGTGRREGDQLVFTYPSYAATLTARVVEGRLVGQYARGTRAPFPFERHALGRDTGDSDGARDRRPLRHPRAEPEGRDGVAVHRATGRRRGHRLDPARRWRHGRLDGPVRRSRFVLSHFSGARPLLLEVSRNADGTLTLVQNRKRR